MERLQKFIQNKLIAERGKFSLIKEGGACIAQPFVCCDERRSGGRYAIAPIRIIRKGIRRIQEGKNGFGPEAAFGE